MQTTRRYPRTLTEAFGAHHQLAPLVTENDPMPKEDRIVLIGSILCGLVLLGLILAGVIV